MSKFEVFLIKNIKILEKHLKALKTFSKIHIRCKYFKNFLPFHLLSLKTHLTNHIVKSQLHSSLSSHPATQFSFQLFLRQKKFHPSEGKARNWIMEASKNHEYFIIIPPSIDTSLKAQKASSLYTDLHFVPLFFSLWEARSLLMETRRDSKMANNLILSF